MATTRLPMRQLREIFRQKFELGLAHRAIARSVGVSLGAVATAVSRARTMGLGWAQVEALGDDALEERLYGGRGGKRADRAPLPDAAQLHIELRRTGVTLQLLHLEYLERNPNGYRYTAFCAHYSRWLATRSPPMRQVHLAGAKLFVDYSGKKPVIVDSKTGEVTEVELFVGVLGASNYTYAQATRTQRVGDWIGSHVRAFEEMGGVAHAMVPDQLKSGVSVSCRYEPGIQRSYAEMARHYGTVILPARPGHARDKAKVEAGVRIAQRWILARLRNQTFFSLEELNERIAELVVELNDRTMRVYGASRRELFERLDHPALLPLPEKRFEWGEWKSVTVNIDYHVEFDHHYYSVPHALVHAKLDARATAMVVEIFGPSGRVTSHVRSFERGRHTTQSEHMPKSHQKHAEWTPSRIVHWAETMGPQTAALASAILADRPHPEQGYRSCLGILRLAKRYGEVRVEAACARAMSAGARSYRHVESILKHGLDRAPATESTRPATQLPLLHSNVRGRGYYQ
jgi:transposase